MLHGFTPDDVADLAEELGISLDSATAAAMAHRTGGNPMFVQRLLEHGALATEGSASLPSDVVALNKRVVHRQMEVMGLRTGIRQGTELCALGTHTESMRLFIQGVQEKGLTATLTERDEPYDAYRTAAEQPKVAD